MSRSRRALSARWMVMTVMGALAPIVACENGSGGKRAETDAASGAAAETDGQAPPAQTAPDAGVGDVRARDAFVPPPLPPANGPWAPWAGKDVGALPRPGKVWSTLSGLRVESVGGDIGGVADAFTFVSRKVSGDFEIVTRVLSLQMASPDSTVGLMARANDSEPGAANVFVGVLADRMKGGVLLARARASAAATPVVMDVGIRDGAWLRLVRTGRVVTAYRSAAQRVNWTKIGSVQIDLPVDVLVGVAVASRNPTRATVTEVGALRAHNLDSQVSTKGWQLEQLGAGAGGTAVHEADGLKVAGTGEPLNLLQDSGLYLYKETEGEQTLTAKVGSFAHGTGSARVGLMLREGPSIQLSLSRVTPALVLAVTPGMGVQLMSRVLPNMMASVTAADGVAAPVWLRLARTELPGQPAQSRVTGSYSLDGISWMPAGSTVLSLPEPYLLGVYASSSGAAAAAAATLTEVSLARPLPPMGSPGDAGVGDGGL